MFTSDNKNYMEKEALGIYSGYYPAQGYYPTQLAGSYPAYNYWVSLILKRNKRMNVCSTKY